MQITSAVPSQAPTRILIVDDQVTIREMLADVLAQSSEFDVVAQAGTVDEAVQAVRTSQPDVVILDWVFPGGGGQAFLRKMRSSRLHGHVLVLSGNTSEETVQTALLEGARGFFEKNAGLDEFWQALRTVAAGGAYFGPMAAGIVRHLVSPAQPEPPESTPFANPPAAVEGEIGLLAPVIALQT